MTSRRRTETSCSRAGRSSEFADASLYSLDQIAEIFNARAPRYAHDDWHRRYAEALVAVTPLAPGDRVIDAATGTGFAARAIAQRVGPDGRIVAVDVSPGMLEQARAAAAAAGLENIDLLCDDATNLPSVESSSIDAVICAAGLLYMPVPTALLEWARVLKPDGVVAFSTMRSGSPASGRIFRDCARKRGWQIPDPSEGLGTPSRCVRMLEETGFDRVQVIPDRVDVERADLTLAWEANVRAAAALVPALDREAQHALREEFLDAMQQEMATDPAGASRVEVLFAIARRTLATLS